MLSFIKNKAKIYCEKNSYAHITVERRKSSTLFILQKNQYLKS